MPGTQRPSPRTSVAVAAVLLTTALVAPAHTATLSPLVDLETTGVPILYPPPITAPPIEVPGSNPSQWTPFGSSAVFVADDRRHGSELWVTDGTAAGTRLFVDLAPGEDGSSPTIVGQVAGGLVFFANDGSGVGHEPWWSDGTTTHRLVDACPGSCGGRFGSGLSWLGSRERGISGEVDGRLYFVALVSTDPGLGRGALFATDGTPAGTSVVADVCADDCSGASSPVATTEDRVVFWADDGAFGREPWAYDPAAGEAVPLGDFCPGGLSSDNILRLAPFDGRVLFATECDFDFGDLWVTDGTPGGTVHLAALPTPPGETVPWVLAAADLGNGRAALHLQYFGSSLPNELWATDGTAAGTGPIFSGLGDSFVTSHAVFGHRWIVPIRSELWVTDGTTEGTSRIPNVQLWRGRVGASGKIVLFEGQEEDGSSHGLWTYGHRDDPEARFVGAAELGPFNAERLEVVRVRPASDRTGALGARPRILFSATLDPEEGAEPAFLGPATASLPRVPAP